MDDYSSALANLDLERIIAVFNEVPAGVSIAMDPSCKVIIHNPVAAELLRIDPWKSFSHSAPEPSAVRVFHKGTELSPDEMPMRRSALRGEKIKNMELELIWPDGVHKVSVWSSSPMIDANGGITGVIATAKEITELKKAEDALAAAKDRWTVELAAMERLHKISTSFVSQGNPLTLLNEIVETAIVITFADMGNIQILDEESSVLRIMAHSGFKQPFLDFFSSVHKGHAPCGTALQLGERVIVEDVTKSPFLLGTPDLQVLLAADVRAVQSTPLVSSCGKLMGMLSTHYRNPQRPDERDLRLLDLLARQTADIIERTQFEETLRKREAEMARLDRLNLVGEMAAGIGHEIRNPMTTVRGFLQMLGWKEELNKFRSQFDLMIGELDRANFILTDFLSLAKKKDLNRKMCNLNYVLDGVLPLIKATALKSDKTLIVESGEISDIFLDEKEIRQVVLNLVINALEASPPHSKVVISTYDDSNNIVLAVHDEGSGIEPDVLKKIGTPFFTTKDYGTGLGLAVCYSIANRHNAKIDIQTDLHGTTFFVKFKPALSGLPTEA